MRHIIVSLLSCYRNQSFYFLCAKCPVKLACANVGCFRCYSVCEFYIAFWYAQLICGLFLLNLPEVQVLVNLCVASYICCCSSVSCINVRRFSVNKLQPNDLVEFSVFIWFLCKICHDGPWCYVSSFAEESNTAKMTKWALNSGNLN